MDISNAGIFLRVNVAAQRARQLMQGAAPMLPTKSRKPAAIAIQEVQSGLIDAVDVSELPEEPAPELETRNEEDDDL